MKVEECEIGKEYYVVNGAWTFEVISKDSSGLDIVMSNGHNSYIPFTELNLKIEPHG